MPDNFFLHASSVNRSDLLGRHANATLANVAGGLVVLIATGLGIASLVDVVRMVTGT